LYDRYGIRFSLISHFTDNPSALVNIAASLHGAVEAIEGPNEPDHLDTIIDQKWTAQNLVFIQSLYKYFKQDSRMKTIPVLSPSYSHDDAAAALGDISDYVDIANFHVYFFPVAPGSDDYVGRTVNRFRAVYRGAPFWVTETGYHTSAQGVYQSVGETVQAKYSTRLLLENYNRGIPRTYLYQLMDEGDDPENSEQNYGLVHFDGSVKPAYTALQNLLALTSDYNSTFEPQTLAYTLRASTRVHHTVLQKSDGTFLLILWLETASKDQDTSVPATIDFAAAVRVVSEYVPLWSSEPVNTWRDANHIELTIPDHPIILSITPTCAR
jgi:hypothetical protein